jgi:HD superfamily phosphodiesterase
MCEIKEIEINWPEIDDFVIEWCKGRDESHGYGHMCRVRVYAMMIMSKEKITDWKTWRWAAIGAILHDVHDKKYDVDGSLTLTVRKFLIASGYIDDVDLLMKIMDYVSHTKEVNAINSGHPINFKEELGEFGTIVRHIIHDADKLDALGEVGFNRCCEYQTSWYKNKYGKTPTKEELANMVIEHTDTKLSLLKDQFIRTSTGKMMAEELHNELIELVNKNLRQ